MMNDNDDDNDDDNDNQRAQQHQTKRPEGDVQGQEVKHLKQGIQLAA